MHMHGHTHARIYTNFTDEAISRNQASTGIQRAPGLSLYLANISVEN